MSKFRANTLDEWCEICGKSLTLENRHNFCGATPYEGCHANRDGECSWSECPQLRDGEPLKSSRHCPLDIHTDEEYL